jgi:hypothetical protein
LRSRSAAAASACADVVADEEDEREGEGWARREWRVLPGGRTRVGLRERVVRRVASRRALTSSEDEEEGRASEGRGFADREEMMRGRRAGGMDEEGSIDEGLEGWGRTWVDEGVAACEGEERGSSTTIAEGEERGMFDSILI